MLNKLPISFNIKRKRRQDQLLLFLKIEKLSRTSPNLLEKNKQILSIQLTPHLQNVVDPLTAINQLLFNQKNKLNENKK